MYSKWGKVDKTVGRGGTPPRWAVFRTPCVGRDGERHCAASSPDDVMWIVGRSAELDDLDDVARAAAAGVRDACWCRRCGDRPYRAAAAVLRAGGGRGDLGASGDPVETELPYGLVSQFYRT